MREHRDTRGVTAVVADGRYYSPRDLDRLRLRIMELAGKSLTIRHIKGGCMSLRVSIGALGASFVCVALSTAQLCAQGDNAQADSSRRVLIDLIDRQMARPLANLPMWAALRDSTNTRQDVDVIYGPGVVPWMCPSSKAVGPRAWKTVLVTAYLAGNMRQQLLTGKKQNEPVAGVRAVIDVYRKLQALDASFSVPEIDEWQRLVGDSLDQRVTASLKQNCPA